MLKTGNTHFNVGILNVDSLFADSFLRLLKAKADKYGVPNNKAAILCHLYERM